MANNNSQNGNKGRGKYLATTQMNEDHYRSFYAMVTSAKVKKEIGNLTPKNLQQTLSVNRILQVGLSVLTRDKSLWEGTPESFCQALQDAARVGIEPAGGIMAQGYLVRYKTTIPFILGYQGLLELGRRSGVLLGCQPYVVYPEDYFDLSYGDNPNCEHKPARTRTSAIEDYDSAYCVSTVRGNYKFVTYLSLPEIHKRRNVNPSHDHPRSPWVLWPEQMAKKTVIREAAKSWPKDRDLHEALEREERGLYREDDAIGKAPNEIYIDGGELEESSPAALPAAAARPRPPSGRAEEFKAKVEARARAVSAPPDYSPPDNVAFNPADYEEGPPHHAEAKR